VLVRSKRGRRQHQALDYNAHRRVWTCTFEEAAAVERADQLIDGALPRLRGAGLGR
jgi:hypothetical protein